LQDKKTQALPLRYALCFTALAQISALQKLLLCWKHYVKCGKGDTLKINQEDSRV